MQDMFPLSKNDFVMHLKQKHNTATSTASNSFSSDFFPDSESTTFHFNGHSKTSSPNVNIFNESSFFFFNVLNTLYSQFFFYLFTNFRRIVHSVTIVLAVVIMIAAHSTMDLLMKVIFHKIPHPAVHIIHDIRTFFVQLRRHKVISSTQLRRPICLRAFDVLYRSRRKCG